MGTSTSTVPTVQELLELRNNCRVKLAGRRMRHVPTSREFRCYASEWIDGSDPLRLKIYLPPDPPYEDVSQVIGRVRFVDMCDIPRDRPEPEWVPPSECILLEEWPVACCEPSRRFPVEFESPAS
jgi:hypothetical protein